MTTGGCFPHKRECGSKATEGLGCFFTWVVFLLGAFFGEKSAKKLLKLWTFKRLHSIHKERQPINDAGNGFTIATFSCIFRHPFTRDTLYSF